MKKFMILSCTLITLLVIGIVFFGHKILSEFGLRDFNKVSGKAIYKMTSAKQTKAEQQDSYYKVYQEEEIIGGFANLEEAKAYAKEYAKTFITQKYKSGWVWDNYPQFIVYTTNADYEEFYSYPEALEYAKQYSRIFMYNRKDSNLIWSNVESLPEEKMITGVERIEQMPELPRGCEVTSLAMLLNYKGISVSKMELAKKIEINPTPTKYVNGKRYAGDPNDGFIGNMYSYSKFGLGVYHKPIARLLEQYFPYSTLDLSGCDFTDLFYSINSNRPVWIITNTTYYPLPQSEFERWVTPNGEISITYREHSVLVTGYDKDYIYFCDPLNNARKANRKNFIDAWVQMGRQAVSVSM